MEDKMDLTLFLSAHKCIELAQEAGNTVQPKTAATVGVLVALDVPLFSNPKHYVKMIAENVWDAALRVGLHLSYEQCREMVENAIAQIEKELEEQSNLEDDEQRG